MLRGGRPDHERLERQGAALYNARATVGFFETMPGRLPPISALRALEAAARHMSFTRAAHELNVTQSAISHQIKTLEGLWGLKLFKRTVRGVTLTPTGEELAKITREFFDRMTRTLDELRISSTHEPLRVDTLQSFAVKWLVPRLGRFHEIHPEIDVWISTHDRLVDFGSDDVDLAIRLGHGQYPGLHTSLLMREEVYPVCTPEFFANDGLPRSPRDLLDYPLLLRLGEPNHPNWEQWFEAAGLPGVRPVAGPRFPDSNMAIEASKDGLGVALARTAHVADELATGELVRLFDVVCPSSVAYYLVCPEGREGEPHIAAFRRWIMSEASSLPAGSQNVARSA